MVQSDNDSMVLQPDNESMIIGTSGDPNFLYWPLSIAPAHRHLHVVLMLVARKEWMRWWHTASNVYAGIHLRTRS
jgi:hypothetical protein